MTEPEKPKAKRKYTPRTGLRGLANPAHQDRIRAAAQATRNANFAERKRTAERHRAELNVGFLEDMRKLWQEQGMDILHRAAKDHPEKIAKLMVDLMPKQMEVKGNAIQDMDDEQIDDLIAAISDRLGRGSEKALSEAQGRAGPPTIEAEAFELHPLPPPA